MSIAEDQYQEIRDGVRAVCGQFPDEYHRLIDSKRTYPEEFVNALTAAGWLSAMDKQMVAMELLKKQMETPGPLETVAVHHRIMVEGLDLQAMGK